MENKAIFDGGEKITNLIYEIRGKQVMLDSDLARLYGCKNGTKTINQAVNRHKDRFPEDFCFQLGKDELEYLRSQVGTSNDSLRFQPETSNLRGGRRYMPFVFTEQGVAMLATILRTETASKVSIAIMRAFVAMRHYVADGLIEQRYINDLVIRHDERLSLVEKTLSNFKNKNNHLFFDGQIYDAYSLLKDIFTKSKKEVVVVDNYVDKQLLDVLSRVDQNVTVVTNQYNNQDYNKYESQYHNIELKINNNIHDRFIIIDGKKLYHCGASFKDLGKKCFAISEIEDEDYLVRLIEYIGLRS